MSADTIEAPLIVTEPGVYDIPNDVYHADPVPNGSLSSSSARRLLPPSTPAHFQWYRNNPEPPKNCYDLGSGAHRYVLGEGEDIVEVDADSWQTKAARTARDEARVEGKVPLLTKDHLKVKAMADALLDHPTASALFAPGSGRAELSLFAPDAETGVMMRARPDWLPDLEDGGRMILPDYKTTTKADLESLSKTSHNFRYPFQGVWYSRVITALELADEIAFVLVFQETDPPYLVHVVQPEREAMDRAEDAVDYALATYADCAAVGHTERCAPDCDQPHPNWPGYSDDVELLPLPRWA